MIIIELDDGKIYRKPLYLMVKTHGFPDKIFPNKPIHWWFFSGKPKAIVTIPKFDRLVMLGLFGIG